MAKIRMLSLFSGIGAPEKAIKNLGFDLEVVNYCEIDKFASTSYQAVHNEDESLNLKDVSEVEGHNLSNIDLLFHGSPCQSFSMVGKGEGGNKGSGTKSSLMWETVRIVKECLPQIVIWENVKGVLSKNHKHNFDSYIDELSALGYNSTYKVISPQDIGEAQSRQRVFVVSMLNGEFEFPNNFTESFKPLKTYLEDEADEKYILNDKLIKTFVSGSPSFIGRMRVQDPEGGAGCLVAKGGKAARTNNYLLSNLQHYNGFDLGYNQITEMQDRGYKIRALTPLEYWRLQGFDDVDFYNAREALANKYKKGDITKTDAQLYKQAGNSINVKVLESFLESLLNEYLTNDKKGEI